MLNFLIIIFEWGLKGIREQLFEGQFLDGILNYLGILGDLEGMLVLCQGLFCKFQYDQSFNFVFFKFINMDQLLSRVFIFVLFFWGCGEGFKGKSSRFWYWGRGRQQLGVFKFIQGQVVFSFSSVFRCCGVGVSFILFVCCYFYRYMLRCYIW